MSQKFYFSYARTGLDLILNEEKLSSDDEFLLPNFICDTIPDYLLKKNVKIIFYNINSNLRIDWDDLNNKININSKFLLIINYFGFPLDLFRAVDFSKKKNLILIEDSTHGHFGSVNNKEIGTFGDYGITSPRKHLPLKFGGILFSNNKTIKNPYNTIFYENKLIDKLNYLFSTKFLSQKLLIKKYFNFNNSHHFDESIKDSCLDKFSFDKIQNINWSVIKNYKVQNYKFWELFCKKNNLQKVITMNTKQLNPWAYPVLLNNQEEVNYWMNWGRSKKVIIFCWPRIHQLVDKTSDAFELSKKMICFSTYTRL